MIKSFNCKETGKLFNRFYSRNWSKSLQIAAMRKLLVLDAATNINDLRIPPSNHLEKLRGKRSGQYSIRINDQWRLCFEWKNCDVYEVEITDYH